MIAHNKISNEDRIVIKALIRLFKTRKGEKQAIKGYDTIALFLVHCLPKMHRKMEITERQIRKCISYLRENSKKYKIFVMANSKGFFIPKYAEDMREFKKRYRAYMKTLKSVYAGARHYELNVMKKKK